MKKGVKTSSIGIARIFVTHAEFIMAPYAARKFDSLEQFTPSPVKPPSQVQMKDPMVSRQVALASQGFSSHSLISTERAEFITSCMTPRKCDSLEQLNPSPVKPPSQVQMKDPMVSRHVALASQGFSSHSLISTGHAEFTASYMATYAARKCDALEQLTPSPVKPLSQVQEKDPMVSRQVALASQGFPSHSLISTGHAE